MRVYRNFGTQFPLLIVWIVIVHGKSSMFHHICTQNMRHSSMEGDGYPPDSQWWDGHSFFSALWCLKVRYSTCFHMCPSWFSMFMFFIELDYGKIYRKPLYLMVKTMVSWKFSLKPIQWVLPSFLWWVFLQPSLAHRRRGSSSDCRAWTLMSCGSRSLVSVIRNTRWWPEIPVLSGLKMWYITIYKLSWIVIVPWLSTIYQPRLLLTIVNMSISCINVVNFK